METSDRNDEDDEGGAGDGKLIPEWSVGADDQVLFAGLAVVGALALLVGWNIWRGGDDDPVAVAPRVEEVASGVAVPTTGADIAVVLTTTTEQVTTTEAAIDETTTSATTAPEPVIGDVQAAVGSLPGAVTGAADGTIAVLTGFVANDAESRDAEDAAAAVEGITAVENDLVVLEPAVQTALADAGVTGATAVGQGTEITVSGTIDTEDGRQPALDAAAAVEGVTGVIDNRLNVSVTADLNELPQVQFAYASAEILPASFGDLDAAAALLADTDDISIEIQGYTDIDGPAAENQVLSQERADAVRTYLIDAGVDSDILSATGFGETEEFGGDLASNRLVRF
ncbi:MAG: OmpA family protein, partial [Acidimicrobiales bacterium]